MSHTHDISPLTVNRISVYLSCLRHLQDLGVARISSQQLVPADAAQENYDALVSADVKAVLNFAPVQLELDDRVRVKTVDLLISLEELAFFLR